jgi:hypothetical protein
VATAIVDAAVAVPGDLPARQAQVEREIGEGRSLGQIVVERRQFLVRAAGSRGEREWT